MYIQNISCARIKESSKLLGSPKDSWNCNKSKDRLSSKYSFSISHLNNPYQSIRSYSWSISYYWLHSKYLIWNPAIMLKRNSEFFKYKLSDLRLSYNWHVKENWTWCQVLWREAQPMVVYNLSSNVVFRFQLFRSLLYIRFVSISPKTTRNNRWLPSTAE